VKSFYVWQLGNFKKGYLGSKLKRKIRRNWAGINLAKICRINMRKICQIVETRHSDIQRQMNIANMREKQSLISY
jgi:hypothetical protein